MTAETPAYSVDLDNCDREPIHILGAVQKFGFLIAVSSAWMVTRVSDNISEFLETTPDEALGQPLAAIIDGEALHEIRNRIALLVAPDAVERLFGVELIAGRAPFDVAVHFSGTTIVIEAEPSADDSSEAASLVRTMMTRLGQTGAMNVFLREAARQVRALTGIDRVMVYKFDQTGSGEVVAEVLRPGVDSFMGLNYPASDIPMQARALYVRNVFRIIADVDDSGRRILPVRDAEGAPLDLSMSVLRAVSPIHLEYLRNMGVKASLSISIIVEGRLWGLFACHHYETHLPSFVRRTAAELFGQMFSLMLESRERRETLDYESHARGVADRMMSVVAQNNDALTDADWLGSVIAEAIPSEGVGVSMGGQVSLSGLTPSDTQFGDIVSALARQGVSRVHSTDSIGTLVPDAAAFANRAAGLLAIPASRMPQDYVVLFRPERLRSVRWAGNPEKAVEYGPHGARLTPRKSFEEWSELVKGKAAPFTGSELRVAEGLRTALLEVVMRLADAAGEERRRSEEQQTLLIAELNHRVRNILALIRGLVNQTRRADLTTEQFVETLDQRIQALARSHDQITADRWGPARLIDLIETESGAYLGQKRSRLTWAGPNVQVDPQAFTVLALVFHELTTNAAKYGALSDSGEVRVSWELDAAGDLVIDWTELGGPVVQAPTRRGFGTTIIEQSIPHELNGKAEVRYRPAGLEARFCVPARYVAGVQEPIAAAPAAARGGPDDARPLAGKTVLLVEDSMIIAMDAEDALRGMGAREVRLASTVPHAKALVGEGGIDVAVLDFNLGHESSLPVAEMLAAASTPYIFVTGYGEELVLPASLARPPTVKKPYADGAMAQALREAMQG
ncbi:MAG: HWE histidine kinase domain-containing protein [Caulobacteraceae bacterium]